MEVTSVEYDRDANLVQNIAGSQRLYIINASLSRNLDLFSVT